MKLAEKLAYLRKEKGLSQLKLAASHIQVGDRCGRPVF